jgi:predicted cupin superfamily sugar epimerase
MILSEKSATFRDHALTAADIIRLLELTPHPEGGHFRETFRDDCGSVSLPGSRGRVGEGIRAASTAIYFLLARGERSHWHRIDAAELWHFYAGAPLALEIAANERGPITRVLLGTDLAHGERPQAVVPARAWQAATSLGDWTLAGCTVAPGFEFTAFELAPKGWMPRR